MDTSSEHASREPGSAGADVLAGWQAFAATYNAPVQAYFRRLPCTRLERDELVWDSLTMAFATCDGTLRSDDTWQKIRECAREHAQAWMRISRHEVLSPSTVANIRSFSLPSQDDGDRVEIWRYLDPLLRALTGAQRAALERHVADGVADSVIAVEVGCTPSSVRVLRRKAILKLRGLVRAGSYPNPP